ncbi:MAG TPA: DNA (cytosine-5-)-methyltransferase [Candidatus Saccharimonadales bacterium]|nr:DNA (cytosine-5-)-methyltransferase [Candidatus Saccharimonadales bacterium]
MTKNNLMTVKYIDLFAGLGGTRIGLEQALKENGFLGECVFTSEIKPHAVKVYEDNFKGEEVSGDITQIDAKDIPDFDFLLAGFPCQPFSSAGVRRGFMDTRGTLFFDIERILKEKRPRAFLLENVEGLVLHDRVDRSRPIGRTLETIINHLENLGYEVNWKVLDASEYGVPQKRKRIYITGSLSAKTDLNDLNKNSSKLANVLEKNLPQSAYLNDSVLVKKLLEHYSVDQMKGKQIKDKRGGANNIHSWDVELKGPVSEEQKALLDEMLKQRRRKSWSLSKQIPWSDGMPLTLEEIATFHTQTLFEHKMSDKKYLVHLKSILDDLVKKKYLTFEIPKKTTPEYQVKGYNIVVGKLSFEISNILDPEHVTPTLVATDVTRMAVADKKGLRRMTVREGLRLFGFPESYEIDGLSYTKTFDLLGNSVSVNAVQIVCDRIIKAAF